MGQFQAPHSRDQDVKRTGHANSREGKLAGTTRSLCMVLGILCIGNAHAAEYSQRMLDGQYVYLSTAQTANTTSRAICIGSDSFNWIIPKGSQVGLYRNNSDNSLQLVNIANHLSVQVTINTTCVMRNMASALGPTGPNYPTQTDYAPTGVVWMGTRTGCGFGPKSQLPHFGLPLWWEIHEFKSLKNPNVDPFLYQIRKPHCVPGKPCNPPVAAAWALISQADGYETTCPQLFRSR